MSEAGFQLSAQAAAEGYERHVGIFMRPLVAAVVAAAPPHDGEAVLDVACGTGLVAREVGRLGNVATITGLDLNPAMLSVARRTAAAEGRTVAWTRGSAQALPLPDACVDVVYCQQGMQFFPDPAAAAAEAHRVLRPGGRFVASLWPPRDRVPFLAAEARAVEAVVGEGTMAGMWAAMPEQPWGLLTRWLEGGGFWRQLQLRADVDVVLPPMEEYVVAHLASTPWGGPLTQLDARGRARVIDHVRADMADCVRQDGTIVAPFSTLVAVGER
jgi:SAM-dependent methyltransferase